MNQGIPPDLFVRRVISEQQAAAVCSLSVATMRRIRQAGTGPTAVMLILLCHKQHGWHWCGRSGGPLTTRAAWQAASQGDRETAAHRGD